MAHYTTFEHTELVSILKAYAIEGLQSFRVLTGGSENTNYLIETDKAKYVLSVCEQKSHEAARHLAQLLCHLDEKGFETSKLKRTTEGKLVSTYKNKPIMLKAFLEGKILSNLPDHLLKQIGEQMAILHQIPAPPYLQSNLGYGLQNFEQVMKCDYAPDFQRWLLDRKAEVLPLTQIDLPKALIHSDVFADNVIVDHAEQSVTIMDFEEAAGYYRVYDIGMAIIGLCAVEGRIDLNKGRALLSGYQTIGSLTEQERTALQSFTVYAAASMSFWRYMNFNLIQPTVGMRDHYLALKNLADQVAAIGPEKFGHLL